MEEEFREAVCVGNIEAVKHCIKSGVDVNSQNPVNGWSALHWAIKRKHEEIIQVLLSAGARKDLKNKDGLTPYDLSATSKPGTDEDKGQNPEIFVPNYLKNPVFPYGSWQSQAENKQHIPSNASENHPEASKVPQKSIDGFLFQPQSIYCINKSEYSPCGLLICPEEIVIKVREGSQGDWREVGMKRNEVPSYEEFVNILLQHLNLTGPSHKVRSIRKLPDTLICSKNDIRRLTDYQMLEVDCLGLPEFLDRAM